MRTRTWLAPLAVAAGLLLALAMPAARATADRAEGVHLELAQPTPAAVPDTYTVSARLVDESGNPLGNWLVRFYVTVDFLGASRAEIGRADTDAFGTATITYRPPWNGVHEIVAEFAGSGELGPTVSEPLALEVSGVAAGGSESQESILDPITRLLPWVALAVAVGVWTTLLAVIARTVLQMPRTRRAP